MAFQGRDIALAVGGAAVGAVIVVLAGQFSSLPEEDSTAVVAEDVAYRTSLEQEQQREAAIAQEAATQEELDAALTEVARLEARVSELAATKNSDPAPEESVADEIAEEGNDDDPPTLEEMREQIRGNAQANAQMKAIAGLAHSEFINGLDLETAATETMRALLAENMMEETILQQYAARAGDVTGREYGNMIAAERERLDAEMQALLPREEYEAWQEYGPHTDARMLEMTFEQQLRAFSSGLTQENRDMVVGVGIEEFIAEQNAIFQSDEIYARDEPAMYQIRAMDRMRERLQPVMDEQQYREAENWFDTGDRLLRQAVENDN